MQNKSRYSQRTIPINRDSKTHIHNIFVKLEVNKRAEVFVSYQLFSQQQAEHEQKEASVIGGFLLINYFLVLVELSFQFLES